MQHSQPTANRKEIVCICLSDGLASALLADVAKKRILSAWIAALYSTVLNMAPAAEVPDEQFSPRSAANTTLLIDVLYEN